MKQREQFGMIKIMTLQWFGAIRTTSSPTSKRKPVYYDFGLPPDIVLTTAGRAPSYADLAVYVALLNYRNKNGLCWPSMATIGRDTNLSRNTVARCWKWLMAVGLVEPNEDIHVARRVGRQALATVWTVYQYPNKRIEANKAIEEIAELQLDSMNKDITPNHWHDAAQEPTQEELEALGQTVMFAKK